MRSRVEAYGKKIFSLSLVFNSLISIVCVVELLAGYYRAFPYWTPFSPYLFDGSLFWIAILTAIVNIYPTASIGRAIKTGRLLFHHYVYGLFIIALAVLYIIAFTPILLFDLFTTNTTNVAINAGRFFILGGLALLLDDLPDVSRKIEFALNWLKAKAYKKRKAIYWIHLLSGIATLYLFFSVTCWLMVNPQAINPANIIFISTLLITSLTSIACTKAKKWLNITPTNKSPCGINHKDK